MTDVVADGGWEELRWERLPQMAAHWRMHTIDTTRLTRRDVADAILDWCRRGLAGNTPRLPMPGV